MRAANAPTRALFSLSNTLTRLFSESTLARIVRTTVLSQSDAAKWSLRPRTALVTVGSSCLGGCAGVMFASGRILFKEGDSK